MADIRQICGGYTADIRLLDDDGSWSNMLLDDADKGMVIPVVVLTLNQKAVVASAFHSTK